MDTTLQFSGILRTWKMKYSWTHALYKQAILLVCCSFDLIFFIFKSKLGQRLLICSFVVLTKTTTTKTLLFPVTSRIQVCILDESLLTGILKGQFPLDVITRTEKNLSSQLVYLKRSFVLCYMKANTCLDKKYLAVWWCYFLSFVLQLQFYLVSQTSPLGIVELFIIRGETEKFLNSYLKA